MKKLVFVFVILFSWSASAEFPAELNLNLGTSAAFKVELSSPVQQIFNFNVDRKSIDGAGGKKVQVSVSPAQIALNAGEIATVEITVRVPADSASLVAAKLSVTAKGNKDKIFLGETVLTVNPVYDITLESKPGDNGELEDVFSAPALTVFAPHRDGVTIRFKNLDSRVHRIHSDKVAFIHQPDSLQPHAHHGAQGGVFEVTVKAEKGKTLKNIFYCHLHDTLKKAKTLVFTGE